MTRLSILLVVLIGLLFLSACSDRGGEDPAATDTAAVPGEAIDESDQGNSPATRGTGDSGELPLNTSSDEARQAYLEGEYLMDVGRGVQARSSFKQAIDDDPAFARAYWGVSNVALSFNEFQEALDAGRKRLGDASASDQALIAINASFLTNDPSQGVEVAEKLVAEYPRSARALIVLAGMQGAQNDNEAARDSFNKALTIDSDSAGALMGLANNYLFGEPKDFDKAEEAARRFSAVYPNEARGYETLGDIHRAQGDLEAALGAYQKAAETDPTLELALHKQGHINSFLGNIDDARAAYDSAITVAPPESKAGYAVYKCFTRIHEGDINAAIDELVTLADLVAEMGTPDDQVKGLQVFALTSAIQAALHAGMFDRAEALLIRRNEINLAIAADVGTDDALRLQSANNLLWTGLLAAYRGQGVAAEEAASEIAIIVANDDNPRKMEPVHWIRGVAALNGGNFTAAVEELEQANHANNMYIRYQLAEAMAGAGQDDEARALYQQVADFNFNSVGFALVGDEARQKAGGG